MELFNSAPVASATHIHPLLKPAGEPWGSVALRLVDRHRYGLFLGVIGIYLLGFNGQWRVERDSALYLTLGRNLAQGKGYSYLGQPNHLVFPGLPSLLSLTFRTFHSETLRPELILIMAMGFCTLALTYRLFYLYAGRPTAVLVTVGLSVTRLFYRYCFEILSDLPFLLGVMAFLAGYEAIFSRRNDAGDSRPAARWYDWALLVGGLAVAVSMRPVMWVLLGAVLLTFLWQAIGGRITKLHVAIALGVAAAVAAFYLLDPRRLRDAGFEDYEGTVFSEILHPVTLLQKNVPGHLKELLPGGALSKALFGCSMHGLNTVLGILTLAISFTLFRSRAIWGFLTLLTIGILIVFQQPLDRYFVAVVPFLVYAWWRFLLWFSMRLPIRVGNVAFAVLFFFGLGTNFARIGEMVVEQQRQPFLAHFHDGRYQSLHHVARLLEERTTDQDWIIVEPNKGRVFTYLSGRRVVEVNPAKRMKIDFQHPEHLYFLQGPAWDESSPKDDPTVSHHKKANPETDRDRVDVWLGTHDLKVGSPVPGEPFKGPLDSDTWVLRHVVGAANPTP